MLTAYEKEKLERIFTENKIKNKKPMNFNQLANILGTTRQSLYWCIKDNTSTSPTLLKFKEWIKSQTGIEYKNVMRVYEHKVNLLKNYGFSLNANGIYETKTYEKNNIKCKLLVDQNLYLKLNFMINNSDNEIIDEILVVIFNLSKDKIIKVDLDIK